MRPRVIICSLVVLTLWFVIHGQGQIFTYPYTQSFDSVAIPVLPSGWSSTQNRTPGTNDFTTSTGTPHTSPNAVVSTNATIAQSLVSPVFDFREKLPDRISFYARRTASHVARVVVEASLDNGKTFSIQIGDSLTNPGNTNYVLSTLALPSQLAGRSAVKFRWRVVPDVGGNTGTFRIDDLTVTVHVIHDLGITKIHYAPPLPVELDTVWAVATVQNVGLARAASFLVRFYDDVNYDSIPQPSELVGAVTNSDSLFVGDSIAVSMQLGRFMPGNKSIIAQVVEVQDQNPANDQLMSVLAIGYSPRSVVVNEIMYAPTGTEPEWVELYNARADGINLKHWLVSDNIVSSKKVISSSSIIIPSNGYIVLTKDSAALLDVHPTIASRVVNVTGFPTLNNSGDAVVLYDDRVAMMDSVAYTPSWGGNTSGKSLERIDPVGSSVEQTNWGTSRNASRSTPGHRNSITRKDYDLRADTLLLSPSFPIHGDSIVGTLKVRNPGFHQVASYTIMLFDDANADSLPQSNELVYSVFQSSPLGPLDSSVFTFPSFHPSRNDHILIGVVDCSQDEDSSNNTTLAHARIGYTAGSVVISEIMYSPVNEPEWVEFYNTTAESIDVKDWKIGNRLPTSRYTIASSSVFVQPNGYGVITKDTALFVHRYALMPGLVIQASSLPTFLFNNSGDAAAIFDNRGLNMDSMKYTPLWGGSNGTSLERIDVFDVSNDSLNWASSTDSLGATPGRENSVATLDHDLRVLKGSTIVSRPGTPVMLRATIKNIGRMSSAAFDVAFFDDRNRDSVASDGELVLRLHVAQSLARRETLRVTEQWQDSPAGIHNIIARVEYAPDLRPANNATLFTLKIGYEQRTIVVNEIMFAPFTNEAEYVELANTNTAAVDLSGWKLSDRPGSTGSMNEYSLIPHGLSLPPGGLFVIASDSSIFSRFAYLDTLAFLTITNQSSLSLNNDGDAVIIRDATGTTIDSVAYVPAWHNPAVTDKTGRSLEKIRPDLASNDKRSWSTCVVAVGGTPGITNSIEARSLPSGANVSCSPNPFSPDGDGFEDFAVVHYELPAEISTVCIKIYDVRGRVIRQLVNAEPSGTSRDVPWDGLDDEHQRARIGIYVVFVEGLNESGGACFRRKVLLFLRRSSSRAAGSPRFRGDNSLHILSHQSVELPLLHVG